MINQRENEQMTPVDDVRRVRERLAREAGGDIHRQAETSTRLALDAAKRLGMRIARCGRSTTDGRGRKSSV